jgi:hypothetical protein
MSGFVYIWRDKKRKMHYIGCHWGDENDGYICSSKRMRDVYRKRPSDFKRRILKRVYSSRSDLLEEEYRWLKMIPKEYLGSRYYNHHNRHFGHWTTISDEERKMTIKEKISKAGIGRPSPTKGKTIEEIYGPDRAREIRKNIGNAGRGILRSDSFKNNVRNFWAAQWIILTPSGKIELVKNLKQFCVDNNIHYQTMKTTKQRNQYHRGWYCEKVNLNGCI